MKPIDEYEPWQVIVTSAVIGLLVSFLAIFTFGCTTPTSPTCIRADAQNAKTSGLPVCKP